jgi:hypothetical protein
MRNYLIFPVLFVFLVSCVHQSSKELSEKQMLEITQSLFPTYNPNSRMPASVACYPGANRNPAGKDCLKENPLMQLASLSSSATEDPEYVREWDEMYEYLKTEFRLKPSKEECASLKDTFTEKGRNVSTLLEKWQLEADFNVEKSRCMQEMPILSIPSKEEREIQIKTLMSFMACVSSPLPGESQIPWSDYKKISKGFFNSCRHYGSGQRFPGCNSVGKMIRFLKIRNNQPILNYQPNTTLNDDIMESIVLMNRMQYEMALDASNEQNIELKELKTEDYGRFTKDLSDNLEDFLKTIGQPEDMGPFLASSELRGQLVNHPEYKDQFKITSRCEKKLPQKYRINDSQQARLEL